MIVAVMQPYFLPYAGYFRLFEAADVVVMFDDVQFPRRGWVHRNRLPLKSGETDWFSLPVEKADVAVRICDLRFAADAPERLTMSLQRFDLDLTSPLLQLVQDVRSHALLMSYLMMLMTHATSRLGLKSSVVHASTWEIDSAIRAQDRVLTICKHLGATKYVNLAGGRDLYNPKVFANHDIELGFLKQYEGRYDSILTRLIHEPAAAVRAEIQKETVIEWV